MGLGHDHKRGQLIRLTQDNLSEGTEGLDRIGEQLAELSKAILQKVDCTCLEELSELVTHIEALNKETKGHLEKAAEMAELLSGNFSEYDAVESQFKNATVSPADLLTGRWRCLDHRVLIPPSPNFPHDPLKYWDSDPYEVTEIKTFGQLVCYSKDEICFNRRYLTPKKLEDLEKYLAERGLHLRQD